MNDETTTPRPSPAAGLAPSSTASGASDAPIARPWPDGARAAEQDAALSGLCHLRPKEAPHV